MARPSAAAVIRSQRWPPGGAAHTRPMRTDVKRSPPPPVGKETRPGYTPFFFLTKRNLSQQLKSLDPEDGLGLEAQRHAKASRDTGVRPAPAATVALWVTAVASDGARRARVLRAAHVCDGGSCVVRRPQAGDRAAAERTRWLKKKTPRWLGGAFQPISMWSYGMVTLTRTLS